MQSNHTALVAAFVSLLMSIGARHVSAQAPSNPCSPVTAAQVTTALGETVGAGKQQNALTCAWIAEAPKHEVVTLMFSPPGDWNTRKNRQLPGDIKAPQSGVGDEAFAETVGTFTTLYVKKGSVTFMVRVYGVPDSAKETAIETTIAKQVASKV
jgi:hypothetical protein